MSLTIIALAFLASFIYIFTKAFQQLNVVNKRYLAVMPTSMVMALCEVTIVASVVKESWLIFIPIGISGGLGCLLAMYLDDKRGKKL